MIRLQPPESLLILRLRVQNANAVSSPLTWGFPAPTAFTGFVHALNLRLQNQGQYDDLQLSGVGIVCHHFEPQTYTPAGKRTQVFSLTRNPIGSDGKTAGIVEEGRAHLEVSLIIGVSGDTLQIFSGELLAQQLADDIYAHACSMRLAGGSIYPVASSAHIKPALLQTWPTSYDDIQLCTRKLRRHLLPGFALISRDDLLKARISEMQQTQPSVTALDALLDFSRLNIDCANINASEPNSELPTDFEWHVRRKPGWLVPIPMGYAAISPVYEAGVVKNARDNSTPFRFVESVLGLGQWISPHRIDDLCQLLWTDHATPDAQLYRVTQPFSTHVTLHHNDINSKE
jgi:CRISPR-associated protein Csy2